MKLSLETWQYFQGNEYSAVDMPMAVLENVMGREHEFFPSFFLLAKAEYDFRQALIQRITVELENPRRPQTVIGGYNGVVEKWS